MDESSTESGDGLVERNIESSNGHTERQFKLVL